MKDSITLTKAAFERWMKTTDKSVGDYGWQSLVEESQKPERIELLAVAFDDGNVEVYQTEDFAEKMIKKYGGRIIKLVEEVPNETTD